MRRHSTKEQGGTRATRLRDHVSAHVDSIDLYEVLGRMVVMLASNEGILVRGLLLSRGRSDIQGRWVVSWYGF